MTEGGEWVAPTRAPKVVKNENKDAPYLPYEPRELQIDIISDIRSALDQSRHIVIESGTGTGKTIVSLAGSLEHAKRTGKKVVYITRTISQSDQVMKELRAINTIKPVSGITLTGRSKSCPLLMARPDFENLSPSALSTLCSDRKQKSQQNRAGGCPYFDKTLPQIDNIERYCKKEFPRSDELDIYCKNSGACPYEAKKAMMKDFDVIVAPYIHMIDPAIRDNFFQNLGMDEKDIVLIVDEAHNLMDAVREQESFTISSRLMSSALDECMAFNKPPVSSTMTLDDFVRAVRRVVKGLASKKIPLGEKEAMLEPREFETALASESGTDVTGLRSIVEKLTELGEKRQEAIADTDSPDSPLLDFAILLGKWVKSPEDRYIKVVRTNEEGEFIQASCIDPADVPAFLRKLPGAVHMSGTLQPLAQYARVMGLPDNTLPRKYPSPFPKENKKVVYATDVTSEFKTLKENPSMQKRLDDYVIRLCNSIDGNTLVFMPSYRVLKLMQPALEDGIDKPLYWELSGRQRQTMKNLDAFRSGRNGVFVCVMGGSIAEGMDFPGDQLCFAVIVGMPYAPPSLEIKAMKDMFDKRYGPGTGWKYTGEIPAVRKIRQAIGRLIRTETDRGMAVILDSRAARNARELEATPTQDPVGEAIMFFKGPRKG
ncbi:Rad3-related DNA helicase [Thermoplasmatales archaeon BRNA1]|nr:Rad3-related DNA helicase [Thermoplasmatales archaeon BRNA1]